MGHAPSCSLSPIFHATAPTAPLALPHPSAHPHLQGTRRALVSALRREEAAAKQVAALEAELSQLQDAYKSRDADLQRAQMISKLRDARLLRLQNGGCRGRKGRRAVGTKVVPCARALNACA